MENENHLQQASGWRRSCGIGLLLLIGAVLAAAELPADAQLLRLAAETDGLREQRRQTASAWRDEAARLAVVEQALQDELARLDRQLAELQQQQEGLDDELVQLRAAAEDREHLRQRVEQLHAVLRARLAAFRRDSLLAVHQIGEEVAPATASDGSARLAAAFEALARAERQSRSLVRRRLSGQRPDGQRQAAEVLALGGAGAWWLGADGAGGRVRVVDGALYFDPITDPLVLADLERAFAVHSGQTAAALVALPLPEEGL